MHLLQSVCLSHRLPHLSPPSLTSPAPLSRRNLLNPSCHRLVKATTASRQVMSASFSARGTGLDPFRGKSGTISFCGLSHEQLEKRKLISSPFVDGKSSLFWLLAPLALISSVLVPQFFLNNAIESFLKNVIFVEIAASVLSEIMFYAGLASFLYVTEKVQRPYLDFSPKRWALITGLNGYLFSSFLSMAVKVVSPAMVAYLAWPIIGVPAVIAVAPFLFGCLAQYFFEIQLEMNGSSCWPVLPIIFEVYRLYQLNKGAHFIERFLFSMKGSEITPALAERSSAFFSILFVLQTLGVVCLWSLATFLVRLFPSRPVAENY